LPKFAETGSIPIFQRDRRLVAQKQPDVDVVDKNVAQRVEQSVGSISISNVIDGLQHELQYTTCEGGGKGKGPVTQGMNRRLPFRDAQSANKP